MSIIRQASFKILNMVWLATMINIADKQHSFQQKENKSQMAQWDITLKCPEVPPLNKQQEYWVLALWLIVVIITVSNALRLASDDTHHFDLGQTSRHFLFIRGIIVAITALVFASHYSFVSPHHPALQQSDPAVLPA